MVVYSRLGSIFLAVLFCTLETGCRKAEVQNAPAPPKVTVGHPLVRELVDEDDYTGWLQTPATVDVRARVRGHIKKIHFHDGDMVQRDQLLIELDPRPFQVAIDQGAAQVKVYDAQRIAADNDVLRNRELIKTNAVSHTELEKSIADAGSYAARMAAASQDVERSKLDLEYSRITAPISGRIGRALLTEGNLVNAGGTDPVLATIVAADPMCVDFNVDERAMQRYQEIYAGQKSKDKQQPLRERKMPIYFGLDTEKGFPHEGNLVFADNKYDEGTGTILVRGVTNNPDGKLVPGARVRVRVPVSDKYQAAVVPDTAVLSDQDRKYVLVLGKENVVLRRDITPGRLLDDGMRVLLPAPGEAQAADQKDQVKTWQQQWVITLGLQRARIDYPVVPLDANGQPVDVKAAAQ